MFTKAFFQKGTHSFQKDALLNYFQVSLKLHCLQWQGKFVVNDSIKIKAMLLIISL